MLFISFTILPSRIPQLCSFLNTIHQQTQQPDAVFIHCPKHCLRTNQSYDIEYVKKSIRQSVIASIVYLNILSYDYGPISKLYPLLSIKTIQPDDMIIIMDDDIHYNNYLIENLVNNFKFYQTKCVVCISGLLYPTLNNITCRINKQGTSCELIEAAFSYIIKRSFLKNDMNKWVLATQDNTSLKSSHFENAFLSDDYLISRYLDQHNILKIVANGKITRQNVFVKNDSIQSIDSLCSLGNTMQRYLLAHKELCMKLNNTHEFDALTNSWLKSAKSYYIVNKGLKKYLTAYLYDVHGNVVQNKIRLHPLLEKCALNNDNGVLRYNLTKEEDDDVMEKLFPMYIGQTIPKIQIETCIMLSVNDDQYNARRKQTLAILKQYDLPKITVSFGFTPLTTTESKFYQHMVNKKISNYYTCGMLEIFDRFANQGNANSWMLFCEDDVRPVNIDVNEDLKVLYNIPKDADLIRPYIGSNTTCKLKDVQYKQSFGGGNNHAFYISRKGCIKVLNYVKKYGWKFVCDVDLYKISIYI